MKQWPDDLHVCLHIEHYTWKIKPYQIWSSRNVVLEDENTCRKFSADVIIIDDQSIRAERPLKSVEFAKNPNLRGLGGEEA